MGKTITFKITDHGFGPNYLHNAIQFEHGRVEVSGAQATDLRRCHWCKEISAPPKDEQAERVTK